MTMTVSRGRVAKLLASLFGFSAAAAVHADALSPEPAVPPPAGVQVAPDFFITGYIDGSYEYLSTTGTFKGGTPSRVFDFNGNEFTVHQAALTLAYQPKEGFGALLNVTAGTDAEVMKSYPDWGGADFDLTQAFVQYVDGPLTVMGGKFVTLAGSEVIAETLDTNFSRSILFGYAVPFTHTGIRAIYALGDQFSFTLGVNNGWDQITGGSQDKTVETGFGWTPNKIWSVVLAAYVGQEPILFTVRSIVSERELLDAIVTWNATDALTFIVNGDAGRQSGAAGNGRTASWNGVAGYMNYQLSEHWRGSLRAEWFDDPQGYRTGVDQPQSGLDSAPSGQTWSELTLTAGYAPTKHVEIRLEGRVDKSGASNAFVGSGDAQSALERFTDIQTSAAVQVILKF